MLRFISDAAAVRDVVLSFKQEPSIHNEGETPPVKLTDVNELREYLVQRFSKELPERTCSPEEPLRAYPSFHFFTKGGDGAPWDFIMEADCPGWRRSFVDVRGAVELLYTYHVPFMIKFSGHRNLHLIIPREPFAQWLTMSPGIQTDANQSISGKFYRLGMQLPKPSDTNSQTKSIIR